jgi:NitT/TauT family transport system ATP-binding protein
VFATARRWTRPEGPAAREEAPRARAIDLPAAREESPAKSGKSASIEGVSVRFGDAPAVVEDVSFRVAPGEAVCLVGPSGGGKSTILNLIAGLVKPTSGAVLVDGAPVVGPGPDRAVVFQDAALFPWLTLEDNVRFPLDLAGVAKAERDARVEELLRLVQLWKFKDSHPHELSGGMRQRGAIARALANRPGMLLFDEPFAALDGQMRELLHNEVERIVRAARTTMLFVTHQIEEAVRLGDRVILIGVRPGRVVGDVAIDLPRLRRAGDPRAARLVEEIASGIRAEVEKVAREEADGAWGAAHDAATRDPRRRLGGGI